MNKKVSTNLAIHVIVVACFSAPIIGQQNDFGEKYAAMSDAQLWAEILKCDDCLQILLLLDQIPISVMAKHAMEEIQNPKTEPGFGSDQKTNLDGDNIWVNSVAFSPDGKLIAGAAGIEPAHSAKVQQGGVKLWDATTGALRETFTNDGRSVYSVAFSPDMKWLAAGTHGAIDIWDLRSGRLENTLTLDREKTPAFSSYYGTRLKGNHHWLFAVKFLAFRDNDTLIGISPHGTSANLVSWDLSNHSATYLIPLNEVNNIRIDRGNDRLVFASGQTVRTLDLVARKLITRIPPPSLQMADRKYTYITRVLDSDLEGRQAVGVDHLTGTMERRGVMTLHDPVTGKPTASVVTEISEIKSAWLDDQGGKIIVGGKSPNTTRLTVWDVGKPKRLATISNQSWISAQFVANDRLMISQDVYKGQHHANLWQLATGKKLAELKHKKLQSIRVSPEETYVASIGDRAIKIWDLATVGELKQELPNDE